MNELELARKRIEELEKFDGNDDHPENRCEKCRGRNLHNWYADSDVWNRVTQDKWSVLCPNCFVELAREVGIDPSAWRISSEGDDPEINKCRVTIADRAATIERMRGLLQGLMDAGVLSENMTTMIVTISEAMFAEMNKALDERSEGK